MSAPLLEISEASIQYVKVPIRATVNGNTAYNPTGDTVELAIKPIGTAPAGADWTAGNWETIGGIPHARVLVGPGYLQLTPGQYAVWVKITDSPEVPVLNAGEIEVTV